jgi:hypothetical protein
VSRCRGLRQLALVVLLTFGWSGCRASVEARASVDTGQDTRQLEDEPLERGEPVELPEDDGAGDRALLGARHDLTLSPSVTTLSCSCLRVALGAPSDSWFVWIGAPPVTDPDRQLVIGLSSAGLTCPGAPAESLGASYWGYELDGNDVVVKVESARAGRPVTAGAIIPKPLGAGQVLIRPTDRGVPYGRPLAAGQRDCAVGPAGKN